MSEGWAVQVSTKVLGDSGWLRQIFYAAHPDPDEAERLVREHVEADTEMLVEPVEQVSEAVLRTIGVEDGRVGQWIPGTVTI